MTRKMEYISTLANETAKDMVRNEEAWKRYLNTAARLYKYPFQEQMLIYAQRPDATACASIEIWNEKMNCWVNKGAKGIALIDEDAPYPRLKYVFDVADVHKARRIGRDPYLWEMQEEHTGTVLKRLEKIYGSTDSEKTFEDRILQLAERIALDSYEEAASDLPYLTEDSFLEGLDDYSLQVHFRETLQASISYTLLTRCGADLENYMDSLNFDYIHEFNTVEVLSQLGSTTTELCRPILMEIGKAIRAYDREMPDHKISGKTVANQETIRYNALKRESKNKEDILHKKPDQQIKTKEERGSDNDNGTDISEERRVLHPEYPDGRAVGDGTDEIRNHAEELSEGEQEGTLFGAAAVGQTDEPSSGNSGDSRETDGEHDETDGRSPGSDRGTESQRPDAVGTEDEQHPAVSGRSHFDGADLQLDTDNEETGSQELPVSFPLRERIDQDIADQVYLVPDELAVPQEEPDVYQQLSLFPSVEEQIGNIAVNHADDPFSLPLTNVISDEMADYALLTGGGRSDSRSRIFAKYQKGLDHEIMAEFLKQEYQMGGKGFTFEEEPLCTWYDEEGMNFSRGTAARYKPMRTLSWEEVEEHTHALIDAGKYMEEAEMWHIPMQEKKELASKIYFFFRDEYGTMPPEVTESLYGYPEAEANIIEKLSIPESLDEILKQMDKAIGEIESGEIVPHCRLIYKPKDIREGVAELKRAPLSFPAAQGLEVPAETFITQDEIDYKLSRGSGFSEGLFRIYDFFLKEQNKKVQADFLKQEYGTGGSTPALVGAWHSYEDHDSKGLRLSKGSIIDPTAKILLTWTKVAERIRKLMDTDRFMTPKAKEQYNQWKAEKEQRELERAQEALREESEEEPYDTLDVQQAEPEEDLAGETLEPLEPDIKFSRGETEMVPGIDQSHAVNYQITNEELGSGTARQKFDRNAVAITTLHLIEREQRTATPEEQEILSGYVGWGGLSEAFDERNGAWAREYLKLKSLLSPEEYASARESTLNAHYTPPLIIRSIYDALEQMGFEKGNVLEPSMGTGNFFGMLPEKLKESRLYGVELDSLTGRIAKKLYPKADVRITGFEKAEYPDEFFDVAIGNVPFGNYKVADKRYNKHNFLVHDYFFAKTIDKVRHGGIIAMITTNGMSGGTFDKRDSKARRYIAQRCDLLGAVRLPRGAFEDAKLTTDILFFQKREKQRDLINEVPDWVQTTVIHESDHTKENGDVRHNIITTNDYFLEHPEMVLGKQEVVPGPFGPQLVCIPTEGSLESKLKDAMVHIHGRMEEIGLDEWEDDTERATIPADPDVRNYSYTIVDGEVYYRENSVMKPVEMADTTLERIKGLVTIRNVTNELIQYQLEEYGDAAIREKQRELSTCYDTFTKKYGLIHSTANKRAFNQDSSYCLLCSLEILNDEGTLERKADMFTRRTIKRQEVVTSVDTPSEALAVSLSEKACVDIGYMASLLGDSENGERVISELSGVIFKNPLSNLDDPYAGWETGDEYLSGNVREKLEFASLCAETHPEFSVNVSALKRVQPKLLDASEIEVRLGATWVDIAYINDFMRDVFETPENKLAQDIIGVQYSNVTGQWNIKGKNADSGNPLVEMTYGTGRANAYKILEDSLNLRDCRIFDTVMEDGKERRVLNKKETMLASQKQEGIREAFKDWVFRDGERREALCAKYNEIFNSNRPREYDGTHLTFPGMTPDISLRTHQKNAVAHQLYGDNTLLAHCVGAGKIFEMAAAAMESKRLGLAQKSLFVVPNHLTEQWASDFLRLYPGANLLAATKKDFEPANRKKFCSRIATGDFDAVIIGHSQFEKIPLSTERQEAMIERQIQEITMEIESLKAEHGERYTIKQMEKTKKSLNARLERLYDSTRKDDVVTFEQLGVDRLFVDESQNFKNLFLYTKMRNVAGIAQTEAQKSSDMFAKCQYMDELTGGKGITFATGTPISNSMTELYTNMRYLQYGTLERLGLGHFDSWAASFGETITVIELAPEGTGYRAKTRFARFFNLPELIGIFKESADIQTPDMLKLPVPEAIYENVVLKPSEHQQEMVKSLAERAEAVRNRLVEPHLDNMLKITNDGRKLALDQRLIDGMLPDNAESKPNACVEKAFAIWEDTKAKKSAQMIFCDLSTPGGKKNPIEMVETEDGKYVPADSLFQNVYEDIRGKLIQKGVPAEEIAFIHKANTETRKAELFAKVRSGQVRFLLGSTAKMGAGTNVQDRLIAEHHLDVPWVRLEVA